jgi:hypothetical protein
VSIAEFFSKKAGVTVSGGFDGDIAFGLAVANED